jgi:cell division protease FtsH
MMVTRWGFSEELGTVAYGENNDEVFLGMQVNAPAERLGGDRAEDRRRSAPPRRGQATRSDPHPDRKREDLEVLAKGLLEYETLSGEEITDLLNGKKPNRESVIEPSTPRSSAVPPAGKPRPRPDAGLEPQPQA